MADIFGETTAALDVARKKGNLGGPLNGRTAPKYITGNFYWPDHLFFDNGASSTAAGRLYYTPMYIYRTQTFAGAKAYNNSAGDTGEVWRIGVYADNGTNGGPGTLEKDFGEGTLTAAAAARTLANSVTLSQGWHWLAFHANSAAVWYFMRPFVQVSSVGAIPSNQLMNAFGSVGINILGGGASANSFFSGFYVDTAYGALASTAVAPTASLQNNTISDLPFFGLYV